MSNLPIKGIADGVFEDISGGDVVLPPTVKFIRRRAFENCSMSSLNIPDSVEYIGDYAFYQVKINNKSVSIIDGWLLSFDGRQETITSDVVGISYNYFNNSTSFVDFYIHSGIKFISTTFLRNVSCSSFSVCSENSYFTADSDVLYNKDKSVLLRYPQLKVGSSFTTPSSVKVLAQSAFAVNVKILYLTLGDVVLVDSFSLEYSSVRELSIGSELQALNSNFAFGNLELQKIVIDAEAPLESINIEAINLDSLTLLVLPKATKKIVNDWHSTGTYKRLVVYLHSTALLDLNSITTLSICVVSNKEIYDLYAQVYQKQGFSFDIGIYGVENYSSTE